MKQGWTIETISSLCEQMNGIWKGEKEPLTTAKILRTTNFSKDCQMKLDDLAIIEVEQKKMEKRRLKKGDIIVEKSGGGPKQPVGRVILFNIDDDDFSFCNFTSALRIKDQTKILPEFLHKYLTYLYFSGETEKYQSNLVGFRNLDFKGYVSICVKYPSISEQQRIVALLDAEFAKIDALKANAEKNLQNAKDLFQAALKKELEPKEGWKTKPLSQVVDLGTHISYGIVQPEEDIPNGVPIVRPMDLTTEILTSTTNLKRTKQSISEAYQRSILKGTEILMCVRGTTGIVSLSSIELKGCNTTRGIVPLCISDDKTRKFVYYVLRSESCQKYISEYTNGTALKQINIADVKNIPIVVAPYDEQATIIYRLDALNEKCKTLQANYEKTLSLCDDLKQALLRKAFNGEI